ncbi:disease resistance protein RPV1-like [Hevea brasiliensis]|uniref:disease resistance protein RPV1-like n=1 Tax=Hevea brasiliensis TaxID=3981 RepID=UPI0025DACF30|nr:disease resistance protein RPV1-like [Hevea brasiliensis]
MASNSSTPPNQGKKWDVFISFRGDDTRYGILSHLSDALKDKQIKTFTDEELRKGEVISLELLTIIRESSVSIVLFSENYADSPWCLDELVEIRKCNEKSAQIVLPVFYKVDPTDVQKLSGNFGEAFAIAMHGEKGSSQKVDNWKRALMEVSNLAGWDSQKIKSEAELVRGIVNYVSNKLSDMSKSDDSCYRNLIGIKPRVEEVERLLTDKQIVRIWGMGGIGKTTIARQVFHRNKNKFDGHCFVENVRETMTKQSPDGVRNKIICELLREEHIDYLNDRIHQRLKSKKVLIVFDDVEDRNHLKDLAGECDLYGEGSRIIITSRDSLGFSEEGIYKVEKLIDSQCLELFRSHAFEPNGPKEEYKELSKKATNHAGGNPLALKVLGSHLFNMHIEEWESELEKLKVEPLEKIQAVLKTSYDGLGDKDKDIFLDIACFFKGQNKDKVERILEAFGFFPKSGIPRLLKKSLITVSSLNKIHMHDLLEQMGKDIVIKECKQPGGRSRLWNYEDISHALTTGTGTENVEAISFCWDGRDIGKPLKLSATAFAKMCNLRFIEVCAMPNEVLLPKNFEFCAPALGCLYWDDYPLESLPLNFWPKNLVELRMHDSELIQLWNGGDKPLKNLKLMDLSLSCALERIPNLSSIAPNVEVLYLEECSSLVEIPFLQNLSKLTELYLTGFNKIKDCPEIPCNVRILKLDETGIEQLPSSIKHLSQLVILSLDQCTALASLPSSIGNLKRLEELHLAQCSRLVTIPSSIGELKCLEKLFLRNCSNLASLPESIKQLSKLKLLDLSNCESLKSLPELPSCLKLLKAIDCHSLESASISFNFLEHEDENEEADRTEHENEEAHKSESEDCKFLDFSNCVKLNKKVMEDVFEAHLLGQKVTLLMAGGEVPERMRYKNKGSSLSFKLDLRHVIAFSFCVVFRPCIFPGFEVDFICESGNRRERNTFNLFSDKDVANWNGYYGGPYLSDLSHVLLSFNGLRTRFEEECFVEASFCFNTDYYMDRPEIMECGVHPIYSRDKRRSRNEKHQDDEECQSLLQILEDKLKRRRINNEEEASSSSSLDLNLSLSLPASS